MWTQPRPSLYSAGGATVCLCVGGALGFFPQAFPLTMFFGGALFFKYFPRKTMSYEQFEATWEGPRVPGGWAHSEGTWAHAASRDRNRKSPGDGKRPSPLLVS